LTNVAVLHIGTKPIKKGFAVDFNSVFKLCVVPLYFDS